MLVEAAEGSLGRPLATEADLRDAIHLGESDGGTFEPQPRWRESLRRAVDDWSR